MPDYRVSWVIDVSADDPHAAAYEALRMQRDPLSSANVFEVQLVSERVAGAVVVDEPQEIDFGEHIRVPARTPTDGDESVYWAIVKYSVPTPQDAELVRALIAEHVDSDSLQDVQETTVHDVLLVQEHSA